MDPTPTKQQASAMAAKELPVEIVEEVLLRFPPDDPASLVHAALVSKRWCRLICGRGFRRRFREVHGAPPLLGFVCPSDRTATDRLFVPTSSFKPRHHGDPRFRCLEAVHSCHGRVLLRCSPGPAVDAPEEDLFVWDPIADDLRKLPRWPLYSHYSCDQGNAAVLCAGTVADGGCDHLDCHRGPFMVVFVGPDRNDRAFLCVYSSEADRWSHPVYPTQRHCYFEKGNSVLIGSAVYFKMSPERPAILKYDLLTRELSWIHITLPGILGKHFHMESTLLVMEGRRLGFAFTPEWPKLQLWSMEHGPDEDAIWTQSRVIDLDKLHQTQPRWINVVGFADTGAGGVIFISSGNDDRLLSLNLSSGSTKVVRGSFGGSFGVRRVVPYTSFCTPALGAVSTEEGPGAGEPSA